MSEILLHHNEHIIADVVKVVGQMGEQLGEMPTKDALAIAQKQKLDLVEVTRNVYPPVCRIMDYDTWLGEKKVVKIHSPKVINVDNKRRKK